MAVTVSNRLASCLLTNFVYTTITMQSTYRNFGLNCSAKDRKYFNRSGLVRNYAVKKNKGLCEGCRRALKDIPDPGDPECPIPCEGRRKKRKGILHNIKLKIIEGGTNFGTPFEFLKPRKEKEPEKEEELPLLPLKTLPMPDLERRVQVSILGADTTVGQYICLMLKQSPHIKKLRLFQAREQDCPFPPGNITNPCRDLYNVVQDLQHIDTSCSMQAYSCCRCGDLELCLQNADIVVMLECGYSTVNMPFEKRFEFQAPMVKRYADVISEQCPKAMVIVCVTPVDCMIPLVAEVMKETGWYDQRKLIGSMAVPEMRASTLAARALGLEPWYVRVPCVGGSEGEALVPLFSKAVSYFDFARHNAEMLTDTVRLASLSMTRCNRCCIKNADLSEAHAQARLVNRVAHALVCTDIPRITAFVEADASEVISPARFIGNTIELNGSGIVHNLGLPSLSENEMRQVHMALKELTYKRLLVQDWYCRYRCSTITFDDCKTTDWFTPKRYKCFSDCAYASL